MFLFYLFLFSSACAASSPATWKQCNPDTGHGFVLVRDSSCSSFLLHHLGELQCYHYYDLRASVSFTNAQEQELFCGVQGELFTAAAEFVLTDFAAGKLDAFDVEVFSGFVEKPLLNVTLKWERTWYNNEFTGITQQLSNLSYVLSPLSSTEMVLTHKLIGQPGDYDQVLRVSANQPFPADHYWGALLTFNVPNMHKFRVRYPGTALAIHDGTVFPPGSELDLTVLSEVYPGPDAVNGNGMADYAKFCVDASRPRWWACPSE